MAKGEEAPKKLLAVQTLSFHMAQRGWFSLLIESSLLLRVVTSHVLNKNGCQFFVILASVHSCIDRASCSV